jgi:hypothetical protein
MLIENVYVYTLQITRQHVSHFYLTCVEIRFCCKLQQFCCSYYSSLRPVYTCDFCCDFWCDFLLLTHVNELWMLQWRNYYGLRPGVPTPMGAPGLGDRAKNIGQGLWHVTMSFSDHQNSVKSPPKSGKWHFRDSRFKHFPGEHALDP